MEMDSLRVCPILCVFDTGTGPVLIRADVLNGSCLYSICRRDMQDICSTFNTMSKVSGTINHHFRMCESRTRVKLGVDPELVVPVLFSTTYVDKIIKSIHLTERINRPLPLPAAIDICNTRRRERSRNEPT